MTERIHYHNHTAEASLWMENEIKKALEKYEIIELNVNTELFMRLGKAQILNSVNAKFNDKKTGEYFVLENYDSNSPEQGNKKLQWLVKIIKDLECRAFLKFGSVAAGTKERKEGAIKDTDTSNLKKSNKKEVNISFFINASAESIENAFTNELWIKMWSMNGIKEDKTVQFDNVIIKNIQKDKTLNMEFKLKIWEDFTPVKIIFIKSGNDTKVTIALDEININDEEGVIEIWKQRIFGAVCNLLRASIK